MPFRHRSVAEVPATLSAYRKCDALLTRGEQAFFQCLRRCIGSRYLLQCKVRLADVVRCSDEAWDDTPGRRISQKHLDFVVCDPRTLAVLLAIELDDRSHREASRRRRDAFLNGVAEGIGLPLLRVRARSYYPLPLIQSLLAQHLSSMTSAVGSSERSKGRAQQTSAEVSAKERSIGPLRCESLRQPCEEPHAGAEECPVQHDQADPP